MYYVQNELNDDRGWPTAWSIGVDSARRTNLQPTRVLSYTGPGVRGYQNFATGSRGVPRGRPTNWAEWYRLKLAIYVVTGVYVKDPEEPRHEN